MPAVWLDDSEDIVEGVMPMTSPNAPISRAATAEHALWRFSRISCMSVVTRAQKQSRVLTPPSGISG